MYLDWMRLNEFINVCEVISGITKHKTLPKNRQGKQYRK